MVEAHNCVNCRITGVYAIVVGFTATLYKYLDFGLLNPYISDYYKANSCADSWWRNLIFINNFYPDGVPVVSFQAICKTTEIF